MEYVSSIKNSAVSLIGMMTWQDYVDIFLVAFIIYQVAIRLRSSGAARVIKVILAFVVVFWITDWAHLNVISWIIQNTLDIGLLAIIIVFQPEIRRAMEHLGSNGIRYWFGTNDMGDETTTTIMKVVAACASMSREKVGALIVFEKDMKLDDYFKSGTVINAEVSTELLRNIFFPKAALHDGAVILSNNRIQAAACVLPLTGNTNLNRDLGTRHRAGIGMSESSDAVVVIVSEETGTISVAVGGMLKRHLAPETLEKLLRAELIGSDENDKDKFSLTKRFKVKKNESK